MHTFSAAEAVQLAVVERSGFIESRHLGSAIVWSSSGKRIASLGAPDGLVYPRSAMKALQAVAVAELGVTLTSEQTAIGSASHVGSPEHISLVRKVLGDIPASSLACPAAWPGDARARETLIREGRDRSALYHPCSGKHAMFLRACQHMGWTLERYLDAEHPLQRHIAQSVARQTSSTVQPGIDGCGAPIFAIPLSALAKAVSSIASARDGSEPRGAVASAIRENGWCIDGPGRPDATVINRLGLIAKTGAEGIAVVGAGDGTTAAVSVLDGNNRASMIIALELLVAVGALGAEELNTVRPSLRLAVTGGGQRVGEIRTEFRLN